MGDFPSSSGRISTDRTEKVRFYNQIWSGRLNIGFSASNPPTDPPFSGSGSRDPPPTCHLRRVGRLSGRIGRLGWVGRVPDLDGQPYIPTLSWDLGIHILK